MQTAKGDRMADLELDVWDGEWGLPSIDPNCLAVMAYCKFSSVPLTVSSSNNPWTSPTGDLPVLRNRGDTDNKDTISKVPDILNYLRTKSFGTDFDLTLKESADLVAFTAMIDEKLVPALLHLWWVDSKTYTELTRPEFAKRLPFPLNYYQPIRRQRDTAQRLLHTGGGDNMTAEDCQAKLYKSAKECLNNLSFKLGNKNFFFGTTPTSLDAMVFGHLAPLLKAPLPNTVLQNHLKGCVNLCQFCFRVLSTYFPQTPHEEEAVRQKTEEQKAKATQESSFPNQGRNMLVSGMVALTAMVGYAFISGLVQVDIGDSANSNGGIRPAMPNFNQFDKFVSENTSGEREEDEEMGEGRGRSGWEGEEEEEKQSQKGDGE